MAPGSNHLGKQCRSEKELSTVCGVNSPGKNCRSGKKEISILDFSKTPCSSTRRSNMKSSNFSPIWDGRLGSKRSTTNCIARLGWATTFSNLLKLRKSLCTSLNSTLDLAQMGARMYKNGIKAVFIHACTHLCKV